MKRSDYMLAALASAVLPNLGVAGVRENVQASATDEAKGIDQTVQVKMPQASCTTYTPLTPRKGVRV